MQALLYNQPQLLVQSDGAILLIVHVLIAYQDIVLPQNSSSNPCCNDRSNSCSSSSSGNSSAGSGNDCSGFVFRSAAPEYWMKLKRPQAIADVSCCAVQQDQIYHIIPAKIL